jgi:imidazolonepropionase-like amidohydrolase
MNLEGEVGVVAPRKLADIVIWHSDPLPDITVLQRPKEISLIIKDGRIITDAARGFRPLSKEPPRARMFVAG